MDVSEKKEAKKKEKKKKIKRKKEGKEKRIIAKVSGAYLFWLCPARWASRRESVPPLLSALPSTMLVQKITSKGRPARYRRRQQGWLLRSVAKVSSYGCRAWSSLASCPDPGSKVALQSAKEEENTGRHYSQTLFLCPLFTYLFIFVLLFLYLSFYLYLYLHLYLYHYLYLSLSTWLTPTHNAPLSRLRM